MLAMLGFEAKRLSHRQSTIHSCNSSETAEAVLLSKLTTAAFALHLQHQQQSQHQPPPAQATVNSCIPNSVTQKETHGGHPLTLLRQMMSVQDAPTVQVPQAQQYPLQSQQHLMHPIVAFTKIAIADHGDGQIISNLSQNREDALITPPHSNDMLIATMLNKEAGTDVGPPCETVYQGVVDRRPECPGPVPGSDQRQQPQLASAEQRQEMTPKYVSFDLHFCFFPRFPLFMTSLHEYYRKVFYSTWPLLILTRVL